MAVKINKGTVAYQLPVTPMVDLVFNLLLFFIMATTFETEERQLKVTLPVASEAQPLTVEPHEVVVNIDEQGHYFLSGQAIALKGLQQLLAQASVNNPGRASVIIRADERSHWRYVVAAMNACAEAGIGQYRVMTREETK